MATRVLIRCLLCLALSLVAFPVARAQNLKGDKSTEPAPKPKELTKSTQAGVAFLLRLQQRDGGWSEGVEMESPNNEFAANSSVAHTSLAVLALLRAGYTPQKGAQAKKLELAIHFVLNQIEKSDKDSLFVSGLQKVNDPARAGQGGFGGFGGFGGVMQRGLYVHMKLGRHVDTFLALNALAEVRGRMPEAKDNDRINAAIDRILAKLKKTQKNDGTWLMEGLAPELTHGMAIRALQRTRQVGVAVDAEMIDRAVKAAAKARAGFVNTGMNVEALEQAVKQAREAKTPNKAYIAKLEALLEKAREAEKQAGDQKMPELVIGNLGLYGDAAAMGTLLDALVTAQRDKARSQQALEKAAADADKAKAKADVERAEKAEAEVKNKIADALKKVDVKVHFQQLGFSGGEEFLSFALINELYLGLGAREAGTLDKALAQGVERQQNRDGSWSGKHCLTGKTFVTAAVLLALIADRAPAVVELRYPEKEQPTSMMETLKSPGETAPPLPDPSKPDFAGLKDALLGQDNIACRKAAATLAEAGAAGVPILTEGLRRHKDKEVRLLIAGTLESMGSKAKGAGLALGLAAKNDPDPAVRDAASRALKAIDKK